MRNTQWAVIGLAALTAAGAVGLGSRLTRASSAEAVASDPIFGVTKESPGPVTVALTPAKHEQAQLIVDMTVNTHTVNDLDKYDLKAMVTLDFGGQSTPPTSAPKLRGHHNSGQLIFPVTAMPGSFAITIRGLDQPALRVLSWP